jgi:hypothetical protein
MSCGSGFAKPDQAFFVRSLFGRRSRARLHRRDRWSHGDPSDGEAVSMATGREWKGKKWWIALPIATRTIDRYPLGPRGQGAGTSPGAVHTRAWAGVRGG